jgi:type IV pilus assembly protein PilY1
LSNLTSKDTFIHKFYVDGTPATGDVDISFTAGSDLSVPGSRAWRTILVGGLGKGGRGYYALDVTNPNITSEAGLAAKVLWEFPNTATAGYAANVGYSFGKPIIVKTRAAGWVVLVTSGYNNGSDTGGNGQGHLFVLNPVGGTVLADISTGVGSAADPSGLAFISAYVNNADKDNTTDAVYGGDLKGNVWRFDFTGSTIASWNVRKLASLVDSNGATQPITTEPELAVVNHSRMIYVGTGQYLGNSDIPDVSGAKSSATGTQTIYGLEDDLSDAPLISPLRASLVEQKIVKSASAATITANKVDLSTKAGWYVDLTEAGERIVTHPAIVLGVLQFTSNIPDGSDPCLPGGRSWSYGVDYATGGAITKPMDPSIPWAKFLGQALASRIVLIKLPSGKVLGMVRQSDATTKIVDISVPSSSATGKRKSWREIIVR